MSGPETENELVTVLADAARDSRQVRIVGGGRQSARWASPDPGAVVLETGGLPPRVALNPANLTVRAAASTLLTELQAHLGEHGLWYPPAVGDTGASTVGGHIAAATAGTRRAGGAVRDWALGVRAVLADGRTVRAGGEMIKNVAGYDLTRLFIGSYGTLGVLVEVALRVAPRPECVATVAMPFESAEAACEAARPLLRWPQGPVAVEVVPDDDGGWRLLTRWEGEAADVEEAVARFAPGVVATYGDEAEAIWGARDARLFGLAGSGALHVEAVVPISATATLWHCWADRVRGLSWFGTLQPTAGVLHLALPRGAPVVALGRDTAQAGGHLRFRTLPPWCRDIAPPGDGGARLQQAVRAALDPMGRFTAPGLPLPFATQGGRTA